MSIKTIVETDGSVDMSKQTNEWIQERLDGVLISINSHGGGGHAEDIATLKSLIEEMKRRNLV